MFMFKRVLITGAGGTVGSALSAHLASQHITVVPWDREQCPPNASHEAMAAYVETIAPNVIFHLATASNPTGIDHEGWVVNVEWSEKLSRIAAEHQVRFVFTSSVMVFTDEQAGPYTLDSVPDARTGYGYEKAQAEERILASNPCAIVARLGWQIGDAPGNKMMSDHFEKKMQKDGEIRASRKWLPACSFLADTVTSLYSMAFLNRSGLYLIDSNKGWNHYDIAVALNAEHGHKWTIVADDSHEHDQRMIGHRNPIPGLDVRLPNLPKPISKKG